MWVYIYVYARRMLFYLEYDIAKLQRVNSITKRHEIYTGDFSLRYVKKNYYSKIFFRRILIG